MADLVDTTFLATLLGRLYTQPSVQQVRDWSDEDKRLASEWCLARHLNEVGGDEDMIMPPLPEVLRYFTEVRV